MNLKAIGQLYLRLVRSGIDINSEAAEQLAEKVGEEFVYQTAVLEFDPEKVWDLVLIKGVLIDINPEAIDRGYEKLVESCDVTCWWRSITIRCWSPFCTGARWSPVQTGLRGRNHEPISVDETGGLRLCLSL